MRTARKRIYRSTISLVTVTMLMTGCASPYHLYWGDVHGHTAHSDGKGTVAEYFAWARDRAGLDFAVVTDHDFGGAAPWRMPPEVWSQIQDETEACTDPGTFVALAGYEWTSQPKYWSGFAGDTPSEQLLEGAPRHYNHKVVYFPGKIPSLFSAKDPAFQSPDQLAMAVRQAGGLIHNAHPEAGPGGRDQWDYDPTNAQVICNTEMGPDVVWHEGKCYETWMEQTVRAYLNRGGRTGFVGATDTHEGKPAARTGVLARRLTRESILEALRHRRCFAVNHARIRLDFRINGHRMGAELESASAPKLEVEVRGTDAIAEVAIIRNGVVWETRRPQTQRTKFNIVDRTFQEDSYYYIRVTQVDADPQGNPSRAWSSPIWVKRIRKSEETGSGRDQHGITWGHRF